jgi:hypothetical protein
MARCNKFGDTPAGTALRLVKKFKAKGKVGKKGAKGAKKSAPAAADAAARPGTAAPAKKKKKASKKGKAAEGPTEPVIDTDITYQLLDAKRVEVRERASERASARRAPLAPALTVAASARDRPSAPRRRAAPCRGSRMDGQEGEDLRRGDRRLGEEQRRPDQEGQVRLRAS